MNTSIGIALLNSTYKYERARAIRKLHSMGIADEHIFDYVDATSLQSREEDYIAFYDVFDIWMDNKYDRIVSIIEENEPDEIIHSYNQRIGFKTFTYIADSYAKYMPPSRSATVVKKDLQGTSNVFYCTEILSTNFSFWGEPTPTVEQAKELMMENMSKENLIGLIAAQKEMYEEQIRAQSKKNDFYLLMRDWVELHNSGTTLSDRIKSMGASSVAIYGEGRHGKMVYEELLNSDIVFKYWIDKKAEGALRPTDDLSEVDLIIVSPYKEIENIKKELNTSLKIIGLDELIRG